ncbi:MAG: TonB-dependent siderophore receptor [Nostoc sp.]|uniref:TonB-dependent siderophore receptor n=1 Tax=Nostoc sp. TaxID=1180 RepID=UPI002FF2D873
MGHSLKLTLIASIVCVMIAPTVWAQEKSPLNKAGSGEQTEGKIRQLSEIKLLNTSAKELVQSPTPSSPANQGSDSETQPTQPSASGDEPIELVVTGEQDGYRVPDASTATKTDTPRRNIPQAIQVVPQQVLRDQGATNFYDAFRNVPGISQSGVSSRAIFQSLVIRGFTAYNTLRDGLYDLSGEFLGYDAAIVDRIEVLKGPASVLYGQGGIGGTINYVTKQPLSQPFYEVQGTIGSFDTYRGAIDLSGPLNDSKTLLYRLNLGAQTSDSFVDFLDTQRYVVAPKLTWLISNKTALTLKFEYIDEKKSLFDTGIPAIGSVLPNPNGDIPRGRYLGEPGGKNNDRIFRVGYNLEHNFSENWQLRNAFQAAYVRLDRDATSTNTLQNDNRTVTRSGGIQDFQNDYYSLDTYVVGKFATGSIQHQLVTGFALTRLNTYTYNTFGPATSLDVFNPVYGRPQTTPTPVFISTFKGDALGIYIQDQISLFENLKLLVGGRFDIANQTGVDLLTSTTDFQQQEVFSPRVGVVYQPIPPISLYASYSRAFVPTQNVFSTVIPQPESGTQYEVGIKADLSNRLSATLAFYDLARTNVQTTDPSNPLLLIQTGKQRSRGIEFDLSGEILPGWNIFAGYAYTDARIEEDKTFPKDNFLNNVPKHGFNLWTTYEIQKGSLQGLGFGLGLFYTGERQGDLFNTFELPSYLRTDAAIFYKRDQFRVGLNFKNLFDVDYFESANNRTRVYPGEPFTLQGTIQ